MSNSLSELHNLQSSGFSWPLWCINTEDPGKSFSKAANLLKCGDGNACGASSNYQIDQGGAKDRSGEEQQSFIDKALAGGALTNAAGNAIGDFEEAYGKWNIFGTSVGDSPGMPPCDTGNPLKCGAPTV